MEDTIMGDQDWAIQDWAMTDAKGMFLNFGCFYERDQGTDSSIDPALGLWPDYNPIAEISRSLIASDGTFFEMDQNKDDLIDPNLGLWPSTSHPISVSPLYDELVPLYDELLPLYDELVPVNYLGAAPPIEQKPLTLFSSGEEAQAAVRRKVPVTTDHTLPQTTEEHQRLIVDLKKAMLSTSSVTDTDKAKKAFASGQYSDQEIELACWSLLSTMIAHHRDGPPLSSHARSTEAEAKCLEVSFKTHFQQVLENLTVCKLICKHLLDPKYLHTFVDNPEAAAKRVSSNRVLNKQKGELIKKGKRMQAANAAATVDASTIFY
ncbi:hypothetical protein N7454_008380 [Penicillium verhagenii]|nr:hypothetical protein N7454_008380 [Penicillium verhagenii]